MARDELARLRDLQARCEADFRAIAAQYPELCTAVAHRRFEDYVCQQNDTQGGYMPAKGYRTMGEELENVAIRLPISVVAQVDAHIETLRKAAPWAKVGRSDALRDLVVRGLASLSQPLPAPTQQPAVPLALEPAPAIQAQPTRTNKTPSSRRKDRKGGNPGISDETLQQIADERTQCEGLSLGEFAQRLFDKNIYRATSTDGTAVPVHRGTLQKWLERAREHGML
jgi:hypothetical protein